MELTYIYKKEEAQQDRTQISEQDVVLDETAVPVFDGTEQTPKVTVTVGEKVLKENLDYLLAWSDHIHAADRLSQQAPRVTVYGIGDYSGAVTKTFTILPSDTLWPEGVPSAEMLVGKDVAAVGQIELQAGWSWKDSSLELPQGGSVEVVAEYTGADSTDYKQTSVQVKITRSSVCEHPGDARELKNWKLLDCEHEGYTGDTYCTKCQAEEPVQKGTVMQALGHDWGEGVTVKAATETEEGSRLYICNRCGKTRTEAIEKLPKDTQQMENLGRVTVSCQNEDGDPILDGWVLEGTIGDPYHVDVYQRIMAQDGTTWILTKMPENVAGIYQENNIEIICIYEKEKQGNAVTTEAPAEAATTEAPAEAATTEAPAEAATTEAPAEAATTEAPAEAATTEAPAEAATTEAATETVTTGQATQGVTTEKPGAIVTTENPKETMTTERSAASFPTEAPNTEEKKDNPTNINLKNGKTYKSTTKVKVKDADGIKSFKLNGKTVKVKNGKKSISFKLSKYKKYLKKKGKWNKLIITDLNGKKKTIKFKMK